MQKIYIITTYTGTALSYLIRNISKTPYAHVSIALNKDLRPMYSFGRLNPKTPLFAGFVEENINEVKNIIKDKSYDINEIKKYLQKILNNFKNVSNGEVVFQSYKYREKISKKINSKNKINIFLQVTSNASYIE